MAQNWLKWPFQPQISEKFPNPKLFVKLDTEKPNDAPLPRDYSQGWECGYKVELALELGSSTF